MRAPTTTDGLPAPVLERPATRTIELPSRAFGGPDTR
jgi:hypothetical protein